MQLTTERLVIRPFEESDLTEFEKLLTIPEVIGWQMQKNDSIGFLRWQISNYKAMDIVNGVICFGIFDRMSGKVLGAIGAGEHDDLQETEIFYQLLPEARNSGYATEAAKSIAAWALANYDIPYIIGTSKIENVPSQKVLEKSGFQFVDYKNLLVHIENRHYDFKYYRCYP